MKKKRKTKLKFKRVFLLFIFICLIICLILFLPKHKENKQVISKLETIGYSKKELNKIINLVRKS